jgi:hypothetical protein
VAREHVGVGRLDVGKEELPRGAGELVRLVDPDVTRPHDGEPGGAERRDESGRLRVVEHRHVARPGEPRQCIELPLQDVVVRIAFGGAQIAAVAGGTVEAVVDALGDAEEGRVALHHGPSAADPAVDQVPEDLMEQFGDPSARVRRVDVPHRVAVHQRRHLGRDRPEPGQILRFRRVLEVLDLARRHGHLVHPTILVGLAERDSRPFVRDYGPNGLGTAQGTRPAAYERRQAWTYSLRSTWKAASKALGHRS